MDPNGRDEDMCKDRNQLSDEQEPLDTPTLWAAAPVTVTGVAPAGEAISAPARPALKLIRGGKAIAAVEEAAEAASRTRPSLGPLGWLTLLIEVIMLPSDEPRWKSEVNPITGEPYPTWTEYTRVTDLSPEALALETVTYHSTKLDSLLKDATTLSNSTPTSPETCPLEEPHESASEWPSPQVHPAQAEARTPRERCQQRFPNALTCDDDMDVEEAAMDFLLEEGIAFTDIVDVQCRLFRGGQFGGTFGPNEVSACSGAPGQRWHCTVKLKHQTVPPVSVFGCLCCRHDGSTGFTWRGAHWSLHPNDFK